MKYHWDKAQEITFQHIMDHLSNFGKLCIRYRKFITLKRVLEYAQPPAKNE